MCLLLTVYSFSYMCMHLQAARADRICSSVGNTKLTQQARWSNDILIAKIKLEYSLSVITSWFKASAMLQKQNWNLHILKGSRGTNWDLIKWWDHNYKINYQRPGYNFRDDAPGVDGELTDDSISFWESF